MIVCNERERDSTDALTVCVFHISLCNTKTMGKTGALWKLQSSHELKRSTFVKCPGFPEVLCENYSFTKFELRVRDIIFCNFFHLFGWVRSIP